MDYRIETAKEFDLPRILEIYAYARSFMARTGNPTQWGTSHPPRNQLEKDIENGRLYVVKEASAIRGVFYFCIEEDPTYAVIQDGAWHDSRPYGVIHRIASDGSGGILKAAVDFAKEQVSYLRIDTHEKNIPMQRCLAKNGFTRCGIIYLENGDPRIAYQKVIENG